MQLTQTWTRFRATTRARAEFEQEFELELLFLFEKCAREAASLGAIGHGDREGFSSRGSLFFEAIFGMVFFCSQMLANGASDGLKKVTKSNTRTRETNTRKHFGRGV